MKVYIAFCGILTVFLMALCFQADMKIYVQEEWALKEITEEAACGAALFLDEAVYSQGEIVFDYEKGKRYAKEYVEASKRNSKLLKEGKVKLELEFEDDALGYKLENVKRTPAVIAKVGVKHKDIFRLPFIKVEETTRCSRYELKE